MREAFGGPWARAAALVVLLATGAVLAVFVDLPSVAAVRGWLAGSGGAGWLLLVLGVGGLLLAPVPRTAVSVLLGVVAGFAAGLAVALAGAMLAGLVSFGLSRWLGRDAVTRLAGARLASVDRLAAERGFLAVLGARLLPVLPFTVVSYAAGLTGVRLAPYAAATAVGLLPSTVLQVGAGASATWLTAAVAPFAGWRLSAALIGATLLGVAVWSWRRARNRSARTVPVPVTPSGARDTA